MAAGFFFLHNDGCQGSHVHFFSCLLRFVKVPQYMPYIADKRMVRQHRHCALSCQEMHLCNLLTKTKSDLQCADPAAKTHAATANRSTHSSPVHNKICVILKTGYMAIYSICVPFQDKQNTLVCETVVPIRDSANSKTGVTLSHFRTSLAFTLSHFRTAKYTLAR